MHFHHRHDVDGCLDVHIEWPDPIRALLATLDRLESHVSHQQTSIDAAVAVLGDLVAEVATLKAATAPTVDTAALDAAVAAAQQVLAPAAPVVDEQPAADTTVSDAGDVVAPVADTPAAPAEPLVTPVPVDQAPALLGDPVQAPAAGA